ncbi:reverse transcriptase [Elysia marginata]|uniref:Reverse transcriptase n=1 Tax=Elysia marginata TaxID=1093978 RepID=A0AAV4FJF3_9GAST|nr:reverse transcriptase [Elysia marginata]
MATMSWQTNCRACPEHNRVPQELASVISTSNGQFKPSPPSFTIFTTDGWAETWHGRSNTTRTQRKGLQDGFDVWVDSADLSEWDKHPDVLTRTTLKPDIVIHSPSTQHFIIVELTVP